MIYGLASKPKSSAAVKAKFSGVLSGLRQILR